MEVMKEETFGPVVGIMKVESDEEALALMNDSPYGLVRHTQISKEETADLTQTASVWTSPTDPASLAVFNNFVEDLECGMVYLNRADAPEPSLPWTGVKDSGRGISLSALGYAQLTRAKGVCMRVGQ
jgi:acyl-CoA reductase-like NAD-dependent aldehyde dehydrogenase